MNRRRRRTRLTLTLALVAALLGRSALAHDATDAPVRPRVEAPQGPTAGASSASSSRVLRWQLLVIGVGAAMTAGGGWLLYDETHRAAGTCMVGESTHASCTPASVGPGAGLALLMVGAQATLGGLIWLAIVHPGHPGRKPPVTMGLGAGTLTLRATF